MKKIIVVAIILILSLIAFKSVGALTMFKFADLTDQTVLSSMFGDSEGFKISKFKDGQAICYVANSKPTGNVSQSYGTNIAISCLLTPTAIVEPIKPKK